MPHTTHCATILAFATLATAQEPAAKLHPYLRQQLEGAKAEAKLPVYFVMADRLGYDHWFPRVWRLPLAERRATVIRELQAHAERTQVALREYLSAEQRTGQVRDVRSNWLGNFVRAEATPLAILTAAADGSVAEVWFDHKPALAEVEDGQAGDLPPVLGPPPPPVGTRTPGDGPLAVHADRVWALGFEGQGVVVMNADSGIHTSPGYHIDLAANIWRNTAEIPANSLDDDHNTFVDDVNGWNFAGNDNSLNDGGGHGTNTAGCIVANGTCDGTTYGIAPLARLMTARLDNESTQWDAIQYGLVMGADLQTSSHSYKAYFLPPPNYKMHRDVGVNTLAAGLIRTNSTSNDGSICSSPSSAARRPFNISAPGNLPPPYLDPNQALRGRLGGVIGVAAWNFATNALMGYSPCGPFAWNLPDLLVNVPAYPPANWDPQHNDYPWANGSQQGLLKPDISAPTSTRTTGGATATPPCSYVTFSGTSNATPIAIGVAALWKSANPSMTPEDFGMIVHQSASDRGAIPGKEDNWGAGVIDAEAGLYRALSIHRVDFQPAWSVEHSTAGPALHLAVDGVPSSIAAILVGLSRTPVSIGGVVVGVGPVFGTQIAGLTGADGDLVSTVPVSAGLAGATFYTQGFVWDMTHTNRVLPGNVVEIRFIR